MLEQITMNLTPNVREDSLQGRKHLVVPMSLIVPGVLNGSRGALYYPPEEVSKDPAVWNGMPLVLDHPRKDGVPISARSVDVLNNLCLGTVLNARFNGDKLVAEAWFDIEATRRVDNRVYTMLRQRKPIELSTGLFTTNEPKEGTFNGQQYNYVARDYRPDHVAILPDSIGACSIVDGCGVLVNEGKGFLNKAWKWFTGNELSDDDTRQQLNKWLMKRFGEDSIRDHEVMLLDVFSDTFIIGKDGKLLQYKFERKENMVEVLDEAPQEVIRVTRFEPVANSLEKETNDMALSDKERKGLVDRLIANCDCWEESDRDVLNGFTDEKLQKHAKAVESPEPKDDPVANAAKKGAGREPKEETKEPTGNQKIREEDLPQSMRDRLAFAERIENQMKEDFIKKITANERNPYTEDQLKAMSLNDLEPLAQLAAVEEKPEQQIPVPSYFGASAPVGNVGDDEEEILPLPSLNDFRDEKDKTA